jgi:hypothetical protein
MEDDKRCVRLEAYCDNARQHNADVEALVHENKSLTKQLKTQAGYLTSYELDVVRFGNKDMRKGVCPVKGSQCWTCDRLGYHLEPMQCDYKAQGVNGFYECTNELGHVDAHMPRWRGNPI